MYRAFDEPDVASVMKARRFGFKYLYMTDRSPKTRPIEATVSVHGFSRRNAIE